MGRMLDVLSRGRNRTLSVVVPDVIPLVDQIDVKHTPILIEEADLLHDDDTIPFIEVGGIKSESKHLDAPPKVTLPPPEKPGVISLPSPPPASPPSLRSPWFHPENDSKYLSILFQPISQGISLPADTHPFTEELVSHHRPDHPISGQYRALWKEMEDQLAHPHQALLFTSPRSQSGTTTVLLNLAVTILRDPGKRLLILDANPAHSSIAGRLGIISAPGLHELMHRTLPLQLAQQRTALPGLNVITAGHGEGNRGLIDQERLAKLLAQLRSKFDWVLIDCPEWNEDGVAVWNELTDATYLVVRQSDIDQPEVESAHEGLSRDGKLRGYVLTRG